MAWAWRESDLEIAGIAPAPSAPNACLVHSADIKTMTIFFFGEILARTKGQTPDLHFDK
jgi:hypothetical protein